MRQSARSRLRLKRRLALVEELLVNARYLHRPMTGVDRVACELVAALRAHPEFATHFQLTELPGPDFHLSWGNRFRSLVWEQVNLGLRKLQTPLLSPCNMGPVFRRNHIVMMHDAQVFSNPESYRRLFRARYRLLMPALGRRAARILVPSYFTRSELMRHRIAVAHKITVVPNGADHILRVQPDPTAMDRLALKPQRYLLAIGSLAPHKNLKMLLRAEEARQDKKAPLVIAGGGDAHVFSASGIKPGPSVKLIGRVSDTELRALYDNALALLFPSNTEGFGLPPAEAMFCGCPVISTTGGAVPEVCGGATLSLAPWDQHGWTAAMEKIACDPALRHRLRTDGKQRVSQFTWRAAADRFYAVLQNWNLTDRVKSGRRGVGKSSHIAN